MGIKKVILLATLSLLPPALTDNAAVFAQQQGKFYERVISNESLPNVLKQLEKQFSTQIAFTYADLSEMKVNAKVNAKTIDEALMQVLQGLPVSYERRGNTIVVKTKAKATRSSNSVRVEGVVADEKGVPIPGVTVKVPGKKNVATISDSNGRFAVELEKGKGVSLGFSFLGMKDAVYYATCRKDVDNVVITMKEDDQTLEEVVVTGYGNIKKSSYTGSASTMNAEKQKELPVVTVSQMMEGNLSGISISTNSGTPGAASYIRVRGIGSLSASNEPLYVLDGVPVMSGNMSSNSMNTSGLGILNTLNPADIENITVLKDAASASLYGARGANGVILITTRKGKAGKTSYNLKASFGISDFACQFRPTMGGDERRNLILEGLTNANIDAGETVEWAEEHAEEVIDRYAKIPANGYADWESALFRKALQQNYDFSVMGGNDNTRFAGSVNYTNQENVARNSGFERYSGHMNFNNKYKKFDLAMNAIFSLTKEKPLPGANYYSNPMYALKAYLNPSIPIYNEDGSYNTDIQALNNMNLVYENEINSHKSRVARAFMSGEAGYTFFKGLRLSTLFNIDYTNTNEFRYFSPDSSDGKSPNGQGDIYNTENFTYNSNTRLNYATKLGLHSIDLLAAYEIHKWDKTYIFGEAKDYASNKKPVLNTASQPVEIANYDSGDSMLSYVIRGNYDYDNRYYFSFSFRRDGSSRLHPDNRWDNFWAVSGSWRFSQEKMLKKAESWLTDAKLRMSYGVNGNIPSSLFSYYGLYDITYSYNDNPAMVESSLSNSKLSWEKNYSFNVGLDLFLFNRIYVTFDWYTRTTRDLLMSKMVDPITGFGSITDNVGKMRNTGFELEIRSNNIDTNDFSWTTTFLMSHNKNKVLKLSDVPQYYADNYYIVKEGYSIGTICLREYAGVDPQTGLPQYYSNKDVDGVRSREIVNDPNEAVSVPLENIYPTLSGSLSNTLRYKMVDLNFNFTYSLGGYSYDAGMWALQDDGYSATTPKSTELRRRWRNPGDITDVPRYVNGQTYGGWWHSSRGIHSTDHLRLKNLILGVNAPSQWAKHIGLSSARLFFSATNLFTLASYDQYDPELTGTVAFNIPPLKTYSFGLEIGF